MNKITTVARIGKDAVIRGTGERKVLSFSVASDTGWGDKKQTIWYNVSTWFAPAQLTRAEKFATLLAKGNKVTIIGDLSETEYEGKKSLAITVTNFSDIEVVAFKGDGKKPAPEVSDVGDEDPGF